MGNMVWYYTCQRKMSLIGPRNEAIRGSYPFTGHRRTTGIEREPQDTIAVSHGVEARTIVAFFES